MTLKSLLAASFVTVLVVGWDATVRADPPAIKRTWLQKHDLHAPGLEGVMAHVEIPAGAREGKHTHPADVLAYVLGGTVTLEVEGRPAATLKAGDSFFIEAGKVHEGINRGDSPVTVVAVFAADKGKPLTTQAK